MATYSRTFAHIGRQKARDYRHRCRKRYLILAVMLFWQT